MRKVVSSVLAAGMVLGFGMYSARAADQVTQDELQNRASKLNETAKGERLNTAIHAISVETGLPESQVRKMHQKHSTTGPAGILIASVMADETKQPPEKFIQSHENGKGWGAIARSNHVPVEKINDRLDHVERAVQNGNVERGRSSEKIKKR